MEVIDYTDAGPHPLIVKRTYLSNPGVNASGAPDVLGFWGFDMGADIDSSSMGLAFVSSGDRLSVQTFAGTQYAFSGGVTGTYDAAGVYVPNPNAPTPDSASYVKTWTSIDNGDTLTSTPVDPTAEFSAVTSWTYHRDADGSTWAFDGNGRLLTVTDSHGWVMHYSYNAGGQISQITNHFGRSLSFAYNQNGQFSTITLPSGQAITYDYHATTGMLTAVHYPDGSIRRYGYTDPNFARALTQVIDESQLVLNTIAYDSQGRAVSSGGAGGIGLYSVAYNSGPSYSAGAAPAIVTGPTGTQHVYNYSFKNGRLAVTFADNPPEGGGGNGAFFRSQDSMGNVSGELDFVNVQTTFDWDTTRRLMVAKNAAVNTALASRTTTQWHPTQALPVVQSEPGRLTTSIYNGQPDPFNGGAVASCAPASALLPDGKPIAVLCKQVQQATTDPNGLAGLGASLQSNVPARTWTWTYDANGQVLTATDPRNNTSTRSYYSDTTATHRAGDLQSVANALGHTTQYTQYDASGNLLQSIDPNGVATAYTYDARQRPTSISTGGQTTSFTYTVTGLLSQVTQPDGSFTSYSYDVAHRLIGATDSLGNSVTYTLDNAGNRTADQIKDPAGTLRRQVNRTFDPFGNVQQISGLN